jgi:radical SAM protein with 4Fe4S-binding SPASM domain
MFSDLPKLIEIEPTLTCNLRCRMCHVSYMPDEPRPVFPAELAEKLEGLAGTEILLGSGFEPTMNKNFVQIVRTLTRIGSRIELITNGTLLDDDTIAALADANVRLLVVSFDGARRETYEHIRRRASYDHTLERVRLLKSRMAPATLYAANCTVMRTNIDEVGEAVALWDEMGFDQIRFIAMVVRHPTMEAESIFPLRERYHANLDAAVEELIARRRRISMASPYFHESRLRLKHPDKIVGAVVISGNPETRPVAELRADYQIGAGPGMTWPCRSPWTFARILPTGDVELCFKFIVGNLRERAFKDIWFGEEARAVRARVIAETTICPACEHYRFCLRGGSIAPDDPASYVAPQISAPPRFVESVDAHNIISWRDRYVALPRGLGSVDVQRADLESLPDTFIADTLTAARRAVRDWIAAKELSAPPRFLESTGAYNLVQWRGRYYALHQALGRIELDRIDVAGLPGVIVADSLDGAQAAAGARSHLPPWRRAAATIRSRLAGERARRPRARS